MSIVCNSIDSLWQRHVHRFSQLYDNQYQGGEHTGSLKRIRPHQRLDTPTTGIQPDQANHDDDGKGKRYPIGIEHEPL